MKQNKKGFTLIELLAVIVILAIIALIAVPVIINIISSARKSAFEDTAYGIIKAGELYYANALLNDGMTTDVEFTIEDGKFVGDNKLEVNGLLPESGKVKVTKEGKVILAINNSSICAKKRTEYTKVKIEETLEYCTPEVTLKELARINDFAESIDSCVTNGTCEVGTKFAIEVAPNNIQNFYVISDADNTVTLIMDKNIGRMVAWLNNKNFLELGGEQVDWDNSKKMNIYGPITALNHLESQTAGWTNLETKNHIITDSKYGTIERTNIRARMITYTEAMSLIGENSWLYGNLNSWDEATGPYGYWTSTAYQNNEHDALSIGSDGLRHDSAVATGKYYGVRPVIEISK